MLNKIAEINLKSLITKNNLNSKKQFLPWDNVQKIALVISNDNSINKSAIDKFIFDSQKYVEVFFIELNSKTPSYGDWKCFTKKEKSLSNLPKKAVIDDLNTKKFELVINASVNFNLFAAVVTACLKAPLKCGQTNKYNEVELIIQKTEPFNLTNYLNDVVKYLKMIKTN
ncbi:MAG: hypothetical protein Q7W45_15180 [Bacteroidota bacterium]|nr:hypothetical protein [Bacteroidota bacterium]MDP3147290.1 hypothetical protein [Bacteroidota bacterium]MDP3557336.1 hypothetical protein [Bacteroidota bacterium]